MKTIMSNSMDDDDDDDDRGGSDGSNIDYDAHDHGNSDDDICMYKMVQQKEWSWRKRIDVFGFGLGYNVLT